MKESVLRLLESIRTAPRIDEATALVGRNSNLSVRLVTGERFFAKRFRPGAADQYDRVLDFEDRAPESVTRPTLLAHDRDEQLLLYAHLGEAESAGERLRRGRLTREDARESGANLARMHGIDATGMSDAPLAQPPMRFFEPIPLPSFLGMTAGELEMVSILQGDAQVRAAAQRIRDREEEGGYRLACIHGDLRLDQIMFAGGASHLTDFEDARAGDPARDIGSLVGDLLFAAFLTIPARIAAEDLHAHASHDEIMRGGADALDEVLPSVHALVDGYRDAGGSIDAATGERAVCFAGWHMFDRMFATSEASFTVDGVIKAAAGIGRNLLVSPAEYAGILEPQHQEVAA